MGQDRCHPASGNVREAQQDGTQGRQGHRDRAGKARPETDRCGRSRFSESSRRLRLAFATTSGLSPPSEGRSTTSEFGFRAGLLARSFEAGMEGNVLMTALLTRRSVSPKRLCGPGPSADERAMMVDAALRAPDHGGLLPWRLIELPSTERGALAQLFEDEKRRRDPVVAPEDLVRAREHATHSPGVLAFVARPRRNVLVPIHEQWLSAGAALGQLLLAAHALGFGAIVLSGERCHDDQLRQSLGLEQHEVLAGFISIGAVAKAPPAASPRSRSAVLITWQQARIASQAAT
jgi:nitroreductase